MRSLLPGAEPGACRVFIKKRRGRQREIAPGPVDECTPLCNHGGMRQANRPGGRLPLADFSLLFLLTAFLPLAGCATSADEYYARGVRELADGRLNASSEAFHRSIEKDPKRGASYLALGRIYLAQENWSTAANALHEAERLDPSLEKEAEPLLIEALYKDALYEVWLGKRREALRSFGALYEHAPDYPGLRRDYIALLLQEGRQAMIEDRYIEGVVALHKVLELDPANTVALTLLRQARFSVR